MSDLSFTSRIKNAWNVFRAQDLENSKRFVNGFDLINSGSIGSSYRPDRTRLTPTTERSMVASLYNRIAIDVSAIPLKHVKIDKNGRYRETIHSGLNECLSIEANIDQTGREFIMDVVLSMFDEGCVAIVPVDTSINLINSNSYEILSLRTGKIVEWFPSYVRLEIYNDRVGQKQIINMPKNKIGIIQNPFYSVMNEPNSTLKRLINKLALLDVIDSQSGSSKLDLIIQLPYTIKTESKRKEAEKRKKEITDQLADSQYGIAYIDSTERITQLNRSLENNLMGQIEFLTKTLHDQLGVTPEVLAGTANEETMLNYYNATIEPILSAISDELIRKFITKTARTQGQTIKYIRDPFKLVPAKEIAEIADKFTRNEILSSNEIRSVVGYNPVDDARADELRNKNLNKSDEEAPISLSEENINETNENQL
ncbi:phage portal protein [Turicimonas muris]|uniref:phage portal protein n=1 Tax=Turicimonas muris TaxID=1796652 RepID=UPI0026025A93|nr:phage portal protein [Turicimonas muris]